MRWFVRQEDVEDDKQRAVQKLNDVAAIGRRFSPFARILLPIVHLLERSAEEAERVLGQLTRDFP